MATQEEINKQRKDAAVKAAKARKANAQAVADRANKTNKNSISIPKWLFLIFALLVLAGLMTAFLFWDPFDRFQYCSTPVPTSVVSDRTFSLPEPTIENNWLSADGVGFLAPGQIAAGDVVVDGITQYDNGIGEGTIVLNNSTRTIQIVAPWGAGLITNGDLENLINDQFTNGCSPTGCSSVRVVRIEDKRQNVSFVYRTSK